MPTGSGARCRAAAVAAQRRRAPRLRAGRSTAASGFTYLLLLFVLALGGVALAGIGELEQTRQRREREAELRFRGRAIAAALARYAERTPVGHLPLPQALDELLDDRRSPQRHRHLRQLYADPFTGRADWELVLGEASPALPQAEPAPAARRVIGSGIVGIRSRSNRRLLSTAGLGAAATAHDLVFLASAVPSPVAE